MHWSVSLPQPQKNVIPEAKIEPSQSAEHVIDAHGSMVGAGVVGAMVGTGVGAAVTGAAVVGAGVVGATVVGATVDCAKVVAAVVAATRLFTCTTLTDEATRAPQVMFPAGARKTPTVCSCVRLSPGSGTVKKCVSDPSVPTGIMSLSAITVTGEYTGLTG